ncbi:VOC family protein [Fictibacillus phosphorivorans]|uniref:VOC family protein n=1 Tax=Fictibacillus phosphorivorans TaxID=1221500 RepID=UPI00203CA037|nr:VOC family protein [Fictibacillus phosphorivorans]MCM3719058.1 VOC family protein [Fictibacillus phosphorivorans]MCM3776680.1 VOC family protein [Fictibacillus phosphorivorans]
MSEKVTSIAPIQSHINNVFVHVSDLKKSAEWYAKLLGITVELDQVESPVYNIPVTGQTGLTLDDHTFDPTFHRAPGTGPMFNLFAPDIDEAYKDLREKNFKITREIEWHGEVAWFNVEDPDGNAVMVCNC